MKYVQFYYANRNLFSSYRGGVRLSYTTERYEQIQKQLLGNSLTPLVMFNVRLFYKGKSPYALDEMQEEYFKLLSGADEVISLEGYFGNAQFDTGFFFALKIGRFDSNWKIIEYSIFDDL